MVNLSKDREILRKLFKTCNELPDKERYHALYVLSLGYSVVVVAELFCRDEQTIRNWVERWQQERKVKNREKPGAPRKVDKELEELIVKLVDENNPRKYGVNCSFWDCMELHKFFLSNGINVSRETIRRILKRNGFRCIKADYEYALANEAEKTQFLKELGQIIENKESRSSLLFCDEMGTSLHPRKGYLWTRKKKALIRTYSSHERVSAMGVVNPLTGSSLALLTYKKANEDRFIEFLDRVYRKFKGTIYFFLDRSKVHRASKVLEWLKSHPRLKFIFLPAYSPGLNPLEWLWNFSRKKFLNNLLFKSKRRLISSFSWFLRKLSKATIKRVCTIDILLSQLTRIT